MREVQDKLIKIWSLDCLKGDQTDTSLHRLFCPRNIMLLSQPENDALWSIYGKFMKRLLEAKILDGDCLSDQCVALFRQDWPVVSACNTIRSLIEVIMRIRGKEKKNIPLT